MSLLYINSQVYRLKSLSAYPDQPNIITNGYSASEMASVLKMNCAEVA